jgi:OHCU decarboxylase
MQVGSLNTELEILNSWSPEQANAEFLKCCGSRTWARAMNGTRPFATVAQLLVTADDVWSSLGNEDWLEAFHAHPKIGEKQAATAQSEQAQEWSAREQAGTYEATAKTKAALADGNRKYIERFGFIFIICASGKSAEEMLASLNSRLQNDAQTELKIAAEEQRKITRLRLEKLTKR